MSDYQKCRMALMFFKVLNKLSRMVDKTQSRTAKKLIFAVSDLVVTVYRRNRWAGYNTANSSVFGADFR